jgi:hypothetical protein
MVFPDPRRAIFNVRIEVVTCVIQKNQTIQKFIVFPHRRVYGPRQCQSANPRNWQDLRAEHRYILAAVWRRARHASPAASVSSFLQKVKRTWEAPSRASL